MRALVACALAGCGRIAFDPHGAADGATDGAAGLPLGPLRFPDGGSVNGFALDPTSTTRYALTDAAIYRSPDGLAWTACGELRPHALGIDVIGRPLVASGNDAYISNDGCATWQLVPGGHYTNGFATSSSKTFALADDGVFALPSWAAVTSPLDGHAVQCGATSADQQEVILGSAVRGTIRSVDSGTNWAADSSGLNSMSLAQIAISPQDKQQVYAIESDVGIPNGDIACSNNGGGSWTSCYANGGEAIAVDPTNAMHVLAAPYDTLIETTNGFTSFKPDVRGHDLDNSRVHALAFTAAGVPMVGTDRGVFDATDAQLTWVAHHTGLNAWIVQSLDLDGADIYAATRGGVLVSRNGGPFTLGTAGITGNTNLRQTIVTTNPAAVLSVGLWVRRSDDHGQTWTELFQLAPTDSYYANSIVQIGSRLVVGTGGRTLTADPPWTTWTPVVVAGMPRIVNALLVHDGAVLAATDSGLFQSPDQGATYAQIAAVTGAVQRLALTPDDRILAGTDSAVWISDPTGVAWQQTALAGDVQDLAARGTAIVAALPTGVRVSHDLGATWSTVAGFDDLAPLSVAFEPGGTLLVGTDGTGLARAAAP